MLAWQASTIHLTVSLPDLVELRGWRRPAGDPTLLAWAIRWYTEHPEDRAGIGTPAEHDRLVAILTPH